MPLKERKNASTNISQVYGHIHKTSYEHLTINFWMGCFLEKVNKSFVVNSTEIRHPSFKNGRKIIVRNFVDTTPICSSDHAVHMLPWLFMDILKLRNSYYHNIFLSQVRTYFTLPSGPNVIILLPLQFTKLS